MPISKKYYCFVCKQCDSSIEETIEKEVQKALDSGLIDMFVGDKSKIDFLFLKDSVEQLFNGYWSNFLDFST